MNIKEMSIDKLKAIKCDNYENIEKSKQTIAIINIELQERAKQAAEVIVEDKAIEKK